MRATKLVVLGAVTKPTAGGYLTVYPDGVARPVASNLNFGPGQTVPDLVMTRLSDPGAECGFGPGLVAAYNPVGDTRVIVDVFGFFTDDSLTAH